MRIQTLDEMKNEDTLDSRDIDARIDELEGEVELTAEDKAELVTLVTFRNQEVGSDEWTHGLQLVRDSYFEDHARELAEDIGAVSSDAKWPLYCIDWEQAARDLRVDYGSAELDGVTFWFRA